MPPKTILNRIAAIIAAAGAGAYVTARFGGALALTVNGANASHPPIEHGGELYIPVSALRAGGAKVGRTGNHVWVSFSLSDPTVGASTTDGKVGQWLTNGIWQLKVDGVDVKDGVATASIELGNISTITTYPAITGMNGIALYDDKNNRAELASGEEEVWSDLTAFDYAPGSTVTKALKFAVKPGFTPNRLILVVAPDADKRAVMRARKLAFTTGPSFKVRL